MSAASALVTGAEVSPQLAEAAVTQALARAGLQRANGIVLLLTCDFARHAGPAIRAASRAGSCLQVSGITVPGLFTESGWVLDQPAAAALVLGGDLHITPHEGQILFSCCDDTAPPPDWLRGGSRIGLLHRGGLAWQHARLADDGRIESWLQAPRHAISVSSGIRALGPAETVGTVRALDLLTLGGQSAVDSLSRLLPPELRSRSPLPVHLLSAQGDDRCEQPAIPLLAANADGSVTLAQAPHPGQRLAWGLRQPLIAESDLRAALNRAGEQLPDPACGIMLSCIGRGPLFYGGDDRDLAAWRERFPGVPLIGAYGNGQLAPVGEKNRIWQNACVITLLGDRHV